MARKMKAVVVRGFGRPPAIEDVPVPEPGPGQVLVKVAACGVCHSDVHAAEGDWPLKPKIPFIPGHEGVGVVAEVGAGVDRVREGDPVCVPWLHHACGACEYCTTGWEPLCPGQTNTGYNVDGAYAEYVLAEAAFVGLLPKDPDFVAMAPIACAGVTTYKGIKETEARPGEWLIVSGVGGLGHVAIQYARAMGLRVGAIDVADEKLELARSLGAEFAVNAHAGDAVAEAIERTGGGAHGILATAVSVASFTQAVAMARPRGTVALCGLPVGDFPTPIFDVVLKRITIRGSIVGNRQDLAEAVAFAASGQVKATVHSAPLEDVGDVFARLKAGEIDGRMVLIP